MLNRSVEKFSIFPVTKPSETFTIFDCDAPNTKCLSAVRSDASWLRDKVSRAPKILWIFKDFEDRWFCEHSKHERRIK
jgi:hypothetical protein